MPEAQTAVEAAIYQLGGKIFSRILNPLIILFVAIAIGLFLFIVAKSLFDKNSGKKYVDSLLWPIIGLTIMLSAIGITYFIGNTGNEVFQGGTGGKATQGIGQVVRPIQIR